MKKELNVIEVPASGKRSWSGGGYCIAFVYSKYKGNFVLKGYTEEVTNYLQNNYSHYFVNLTIYSNNGFRSIWKFWKNGYYIRQPDRRRVKQNGFYKYETNYKWILKCYSKDNVIMLKFRRFPNRWIPEFDNLK